MKRALSIMTFVGAFGAAIIFASLAEAAPGNECRRSSTSLYHCCALEAAGAWHLAIAKCLNDSDPDNLWACQRDAKHEFQEEKGLCREQLGARRDVCDAIGPAPYDPPFDPDMMVEEIDNPLLPFKPGSRWVYEGETEDGTETNVVEVLDETQEVDGVECQTVLDEVYLDGDLIERTFDWYSQDFAGNVHYCGELSYEVEDDVIVSLAGSWKAGEDGAKTGVVMQAAPMMGQTYRQEWLPKEAEDMAEVVGLDEAVEVPFGAFEGCLKTREFTPIEPGVNEFKTFCEGVGLVLEEDPDTGERLELVAFTEGE